MILFNWDNTLFPTEHLIKIYRPEYFIDVITLYHKLDTRDFIKFNKVADKIIAPLIRLLKQASDLGEVYIVTNGRWDWFMKSLNLLPTLAIFIESNNMDVSRNKIRFFSTCGDLLENGLDIGVRKLHTLYSILQHKMGTTNIISIGDSNDERQIVHSVVRYSTSFLCIYI